MFKSAIIHSPDEHFDSAERIVSALRARFSFSPEISSTPPPAGQPVIALGCLADNATIRAAYFRFRTLVDRWYPGKGGYVLQRIRVPGEVDVLVVGGSDAAGVCLAADRLVAHIAELPTAECPWLFEVQLGNDHLPLPEDRIDVLGTSAGALITKESKLPESPYESGFPPGGDPHLHLLRLGMYGPHADNSHFSRSSQFGLRYLYTGSEADGQRYRQTLLEEIEIGLLPCLYHYKSIRMFSLWEIFGDAPFFSPAERDAIGSAILDYLEHGTGVAALPRIEAGTVTERIFDRHVACDALNLLLGSDWMYRRTGEARWRDLRAVGDAYFRAQRGTDVPFTGLTEGYFSYCEVYLEWLLQMHPEEISDSSELRLWAERCLGLLTNQGGCVCSVQSDMARYGYNLLRRLAFLLDDGRFLFAAQLRERQVLRGNDRVVQFTAGQAFAGDVQPRIPSNAGRLQVYPLNDRVRRWLLPELPTEKGFDRATGRSGWELEDEYLLFVGARGGGKTLPNVGSLAAYERFGLPLIVSPVNGLIAGENSPSGYSLVTVSRGGLGGTPNALAEVVDERVCAGVKLFTFRIAAPDSHVWTRTVCWKEKAFLLICDQVEAVGEFSFTAHWRCAHGMEICGNLAHSRQTSPEGCASRFFIESDSASSFVGEKRTGLQPYECTKEKDKSVFLLHNTLDRQNGSGQLATLLHAVPGKSDPAYRLENSAGGIAVVGREERFCFSGLGSKNPDCTVSPASGCFPRISAASAVPAIPAAVADQAEVTAVCEAFGDRILGTRSGHLSRMAADGTLRWERQCEFRPERDFWSWWFLPTPLIASLEAARFPDGREILAAGTGSCSLLLLDAQTGEILRDEISPYGLPEQIEVATLPGESEPRFFVGHPRLTPNSTVQAWPLEGPPLAYKAVCGARDPRSPGWDMCGCARFVIEGDYLLILRNGTFEQLACYALADASPLWMRPLGITPETVTIEDGEIMVHGTLGENVRFDFNGDLLDSRLREGK